MHTPAVVLTPPPAPLVPVLPLVPVDPLVPVVPLVLVAVPAVLPEPPAPPSGGVENVQPNVPSPSAAALHTPTQTLLLVIATT
jgi:hypothetical protein